MWSDETKIKLFGINSTCRVWRGKNAEYDTIPTVETLCFGAVSLPRVQDDSTAGRDGWGSLVLVSCLCVNVCVCLCVYVLQCYLCF